MLLCAATELQLLDGVSAMSCRALRASQQKRLAPSSLLQPCPCGAAIYHLVLPAGIAAPWHKICHVLSRPEGFTTENLALVSCSATTIAVLVWSVGSVQHILDSPCARAMNRISWSCSLHMHRRWNDTTNVSFAACAWGCHVQRTKCRAEYSRQAVTAQQHFQVTKQFKVKPVYVCNSVISALQSVIVAS